MNKLAIALALVPSVAWAQGAILQNGPVTNYEIGGFIGDHRMESGLKMRTDNGRGFAPSYFFDNGGPGVCTDNALTTGAYSEFCLGHDTSGNGVISLNSANGAPNGSVNFNINGVVYPFPGAGNGNVLGPNPTVTGNIPLWNNTLGTLQSDSGLPFAKLRKPTSNNAVAGNFYVGGTGASDSADCQTSTVTGGHGPCATISHALSVALAYDAGSTNLQINIASGTYNENIVISGTSVAGASVTPFTTAAASVPMITLVGGGSGNTTISGQNFVGGQSFCYAVLAQNSATIGLKALSVTANTGGGTCTQSDLYAERNAQIYILGDVKLLTATGNLISEEDAARVWVNPGDSTRCALTLAGNAINGINISAQSQFWSDSEICFGNTPAFSGTLLLAEYQSLFKLYGSVAVTSGAGSFTGSRYFIGGNSVLYVAHPPATWPGTIGSMGNGSRYESSDDKACVGGTVGCVNVTVATGNGSTGGYIDNNNSMQGYTGSIQLTPNGTGIGTVGTVGVGLPYLLNNGLCMIDLTNGTGSWNPRATAHTNGFPGATGFNISWDNNSVALTAGSIYFLNYACQNGN